MQRSAVLQSILNFLSAGSNISFTGSGTPADPLVINSTASGSGDVSGPASSTDNAVARYDGTTGKIIQNSAGVITDTGQFLINSINAITGAGNCEIKDITTGTGSTDSGFTMTGGGSLQSALFTEVTGTILSYAINTPQITTRVTGTVGGIFRLDTRTGVFTDGAQSFIVFGVPTGAGSTEQARLIVSLQDGNTALCPVAGRVSIGDLPSTGLTAQVATNALTISKTNATTQFAMENKAASSSTTGSGAIFFSNDGALMASGDRLGYLGFGGSTGASTLATTALMVGFATQAWSGSALGTEIQFQTTPNGSLTRQTSVTMTNSGGLIVNEQGLSTGDMRVEGDTDSNLLFTDASADSVGVGTATPNSKLQVAGSLSVPVTTVSSDTTLNSTHHTVLVDASGAARTITLPAASTCTGRIYIIKKIDNSVNAVTIDGATIDGAITQTLSAQWNFMSAQSDGTSYFIIGQ